MSDFIDDGNLPSDSIAHASFASLKGKRLPLDSDGNHLILGDAGNPHLLARPYDRLLVGTLYGTDNGVIGKSILVYFDGTFQQAYGWLHVNKDRAMDKIVDALHYGLNEHGYVLGESAVLPQHKSLHYSNLLTAKQLEGIAPKVLKNAIFSHYGTLCAITCSDADFNWRDLFRDPAPTSEYINFRGTRLETLLSSSDTRHRYVDFTLEYHTVEDMPEPTCRVNPTTLSNTGAFNNGLIGIRHRLGLIINSWVPPADEPKPYRYGRIDGVKYMAIDLRGSAFHYHPEHWFEADRERMAKLFDNPVLRMHFNALLMTPDSQALDKLTTDVQWEHTQETVGTDAYAEALYRDCVRVIERGISLRTPPKKITLQMLTLSDVGEQPVQPPEDDTSPSEGDRGWVWHTGLWKRLFGR